MADKNRLQGNINPSIGSLRRPICFVRALAFYFTRLRGINFHAVPRRLSTFSRYSVGSILLYRVPIAALVSTFFYASLSRVDRNNRARQKSESRDFQNDWEFFSRRKVRESSRVVTLKKWLTSVIFRRESLLSNR